MQENISFMGFSVRVEMSVLLENCICGNHTDPRYPPNTIIPRNVNINLHLKPINDINNTVLVHY